MLSIIKMSMYSMEKNSQPLHITNSDCSGFEIIPWTTFKNMSTTETQEHSVVTACPSF